MPARIILTDLAGNHFIRGTITNETAQKIMAVVCDAHDANWQRPSHIPCQQKRSVLREPKLRRLHGLGRLRRARQGT